MSVISFLTVGRAVLVIIFFGSLIGAGREERSVAFVYSLVHPSVAGPCLCCTQGTRDSRSIIFDFASWELCGSWPPSGHRGIRNYGSAPKSCQERLCRGDASKSCQSVFYPTFSKTCPCLVPWLRPCFSLHLCPGPRQQPSSSPSLELLPHLLLRDLTQSYGFNYHQ